MTYEELILKVKETQSVEELIALAKEKGLDLSEEKAKSYFAQTHGSGELSDDELDNVSGGACHTSVGGESYTVVTCDVACFTGQFENNEYRAEDGHWVARRQDNQQLRALWSNMTSNAKQTSARSVAFCGNCYHLEFKNGTGYCGKS